MDYLITSKFTKVATVSKLRHFLITYVHHLMLLLNLLKVFLSILVVGPRPSSYTIEYRNVILCTFINHNANKNI